MVNESFQVSVIIPAFNAEKYLAQAVQSALAQPETAEVILVEDGSSDTTLSVCQHLVTQYPDRLHLHQHPVGRNQGAGPSRNLGIKMASSPYVAFLDADDFYLPNCFAAAKEILLENAAMDGVYGALGVHFETPEVEALYGSLTTFSKITTVTEKIPPDQLFERMSPLGSAGFFHLNTLVVKKAVLEKTGLFNNLTIGQDTHFRLRLAYVAQLAPGSIDQPIAIRRVHAQNRITKAYTDPQLELQVRLKIMFSLRHWAQENALSQKHFRLIQKHLFKQTRQYIKYAYAKKIEKHLFLRYLLSWGKIFAGVAAQLIIHNRPLVSLLHLNLTEIGVPEPL
jgi:glycosyltransferase involved in cell wall biosynthesis